MTETVRIDRATLEQTARRALTRAGMNEADAATAANILVLSNLMGIDTHGVSRLVQYVERLVDGAYKATGRPSVEERSPSLALVEGDDALGPVIGQLGLETALKLVPNTGIAYVGCRNSNHFGPLAPYAWQACRKGYVAILGTAATKSIAPWGGAEVRVGNNPFGIAAPRADAFPFILDMAMSVGARGKIRGLRDKGLPVPEGWALDSEGKPTTDPVKALAGFMMPVGGHKGYGLALAVDLLAGLITGGRFLTEVQTWTDQTTKPSRLGHFFVLIDPDRLIGKAEYDRRMEDFCALVKSTPAIDPARPVMLPGEPEGTAFADRTANGVPLTPAMWRTVQELAAA